MRQKLGSRRLAAKVENLVKKLSKANKEKMINVPGCFDELVRQADK